MQGKSQSDRHDHDSAATREFVCRFGPAVWQSLHRGRKWEHDCRTPFPVAMRMWTNQRKAGRCQACLDLFTSAMALVHQKRALVTAAQRPEAYAARITQNWFDEYLLKHRVEAHGLSKPDALVGVPRRIYRQHGNRWYATVLSWLLDDASKVGAVPATVWRYEGLRECRSRDLGVPRTAAFDDQVRLDVAEVLRIATEVAGSAWVDKYLTAPVQRRRAEHTPFRLDGGGADDRPAIDPAMPPRQRVDDLADAMRRHFFTALAECSALDAVHAAARQLVPGSVGPRHRATKECLAYVVQLLIELVCDRVGTTADGALGQALSPGDVRAIVAEHAGAAAAGNVDGVLLERVAVRTQQLAKPPADRWRAR